MTKNKKTARPGDVARFENSKIIVTDIAKKLIATLERNEEL